MWYYYDYCVWKWSFAHTQRNLPFFESCKIRIEKAYLNGLLVIKPYKFYLLSSKKCDLAKTGLILYWSHLWVELFTVKVVLSGILRLGFSAFISILVYRYKHWSHLHIVLLYLYIFYDWVCTYIRIYFNCFIYIPVLAERMDRCCRIQHIYFIYTYSCLLFVVFLVMGCASTIFLLIVLKSLLAQFVILCCSLFMLTFMLTSD